jgi:hypothetical protein
MRQFAKRFYAPEETAAWYRLYAGESGHARRGTRQLSFFSMMYENLGIEEIATGRRWRDFGPLRSEFVPPPDVNGLVSAESTSSTNIEDYPSTSDLSSVVSRGMRLIIDVTCKNEVLWLPIQLHNESGIAIHDEYFVLVPRAVIFCTDITNSERWLTETPPWGGPNYLDHYLELKAIPEHVNVFRSTTVNAVYFRATVIESLLESGMTGFTVANAHVMGRPYN